MVACSGIKVAELDRVLGKPNPKCGHFGYKTLTLEHINTGTLLNRVIQHFIFTNPRLQLTILLINRSLVISTQKYLHTLFDKPQRIVQKKLVALVQRLNFLNK